MQDSSQFGDAAVKVFTFDSSVRVFFFAVALMAFVAVGMRSRMFSVWGTLQEQFGGEDVSMGSFRLWECNEEVVAV